MFVELLTKMSMFGSEFSSGSHNLKGVGRLLLVKLFPKWRMSGSV